MLDARQRRNERYRRYRDGEHPLFFATDPWREQFGGLFEGWHDNWCDLPIKLAVDALGVLGYRFGEEEKGDKDAYELHQRNGLGIFGDLAHEDACTGGMGYYLVGPGEPRAKITVEDSAQCIVDGDVLNRRAGLKRWIDDDGRAICQLYLPTGIYNFRSKQKYRPGAKVRWEERPGTYFEIRHRLNAVLLIPIVNRITFRDGRSDIAQAIPIQNAVNKFFADMVIASEFAAYRQRWAVGVEPVDDDDEDEEESAEERQFSSGISRFMTLASHEARFGEFSETNLENYVKVVELGVRHISAKTQTPPQDVAGTVINVNAQTLESVRAGFIQKTEGKQTSFGTSRLEAMRVAYAIEGDRARASDASAEVIWSSPEYRTQSEMADAAQKRRALGYPLRAVWEFLGETPRAMDRYEDMLRREQAELAAFTFTGAPGEQGVPPEAPSSATSLWLPESSR